MATATSAARRLARWPAVVQWTGSAHWANAADNSGLSAIIILRSRDHVRQKMVESTLRHASLRITEPDAAYTIFQVIYRKRCSHMDSAPQTSATMEADGASDGPLITSGVLTFLRRAGAMLMTVEMRELYSSPNGDRWYLARDIDLGQVFIRHEPNLPSGGKAVRIEVGAFLSQSGRGPEHRELLRLIGTLAESDHSFETGTAARIKSHAKSYIVELTDGSKWRIWPGDLATTLGWTSEAEIEVLPIEDEFCSHVLVDQSGGSRVRAIEASNDWPIEKLRKSLDRG